MLAIDTAFAADATPRCRLYAGHDAAFDISLRRCRVLLRHTARRPCAACCHATLYL